MTTKQLLKIVEDRGMKVEVRDGVPYLTGKTSEHTDKLMAVLRLHRAAIVSMRKLQKCSDQKT